MPKAKTTSNPTGDSIGITHPAGGDYDLSIGESVYPVVAGRTVIPESDLAAALMVGFVVEQVEAAPDPAATGDPGPAPAN